MSVGRPPKSMAQRRIEGNPGKRALQVGTPNPVLLNEDRAAEVRNAVLTSKEARFVWDIVYPGLRAAKMISEVDAFGLVRYCEAEAWAWTLRKQRKAALSAPVAEGEDDNSWSLIQSLSMQEKWSNEAANTGAARLGLDGASRTRIKVDTQLDLFAEEVGTVVPILRAVEIAREVMGGAKGG